MIFEWWCPVFLADDVERVLLRMGWRIHKIFYTIFGQVCFMCSYNPADWN